MIQRSHEASELQSAIPCNSRIIMGPQTIQVHPALRSLGRVCLQSPLPPSYSNVRSDSGPVTSCGGHWHCTARTMHSPSERFPSCFLRMKARSEAVCSGWPRHSWCLVRKGAAGLCLARRLCITGQWMLVEP
ncbi:hypothetical protein VFPPC_15452 [Pochonia chlamydosporia 170]|uniref:Uncharacterized protein n=1 Tax=Pochonia chlamydosporia 170 TaxID=1380566 RepID=A0A179GA60_METCM|nr:hypothetical protein VFPPC_15452 [Pochonia chlamydosporia 170]OAQ74380.1 hypothetical protein VFPPC_15452 [Pochonia chlamydosporia 170]